MTQPAAPAPALPVLGVAVVAFDSADIILDCLESLLAARGVRLVVAVVDNASRDGTAAAIRDWASGRVAWVPPADLPFPLAPAPKPLDFTDGPAPDPVAGPGHRITLIESGVNRGFAGGVNLGLAELARYAEIDRFWVLNPDSVVPPETPAAFATHPAGEFSLMGGRVTYYDRPDMVQIDGGTVDRRTGVTGNVNLRRSVQETAAPDPATLDFITGASMVASRRFYETVGPMREDYFLYYEEVDWALRRGALPLALCPEARVYHRAGGAIGSPAPGRIASPFSLYFKYRGRMLFVRRHLPRSLPGAWAYTLAKAVQYRLKGHRAEAAAMLAGARDRTIPAHVRDRLGPEAVALIASSQR